MTTLFDGYRSDYGNVVEGSVRFSGLKHDFFLQAKVDILRRIIAARGLAGDDRLPRALDVGCGIGALHHFSRLLFEDLSSCDISADSADNPWVDYRAYEAPRLPYDDAAFDLAFAVCVVHHVPPAKWAGFVGEMRRVVRPGRIVCLIEHNPFNPLTKLAVMRCPFDEDAVLLNRWTSGKLLAGAGLKQVESDHFLLFQGPAACRGRSSGDCPAGRWVPNTPAARGCGQPCGAAVAFN